MNNEQVALIAASIIISACIQKDMVECDPVGQEKNDHKLIDQIFDIKSQILERMADA